MRCKFCGYEMNPIYDWDKTQKDGYCSKFHRKDHEIQLIKEGKMEGVFNALGFGVMVDSTLRDDRGEQVYFPKVGGYYDRALQKKFNSKKEKIEYMKEHNLVMDGSSDMIRKPIEAGDHRFERVR